MEKENKEMKAYEFHWPIIPFYGDRDRENKHDRKK